MLALSFRTPELRLEADETGDLSQAIANVSRHYDIPDVSGKVIDWMGLVMVAGKVYGPRAIIVGANMKAARAKNAKPARKTFPVIDGGLSPNFTPGPSMTAQFDHGNETGPLVS